MFADDTNIQIEATSICKLNGIMKEVMQQLSRWFHENKLIINPDKTTAMSFHAWQNKNNPTPKILFQDMLIKYTYETRFLGIHLTEDVKWDVHVNHVCDTLNKSFYLIHSLKNVLGINALRGIYFANFHSHLRYGIIFWGGDSHGLKAFKMQKRLVRLMGNVQKKNVM